MKTSFAASLVAFASARAGMPDGLDWDKDDDFFAGRRITSIQDRMSKMFDRDPAAIQERFNSGNPIDIDADDLVLGAEDADILDSDALAKEMASLDSIEDALAEADLGEKLAKGLGLGDTVVVPVDVEELVIEDDTIVPVEIDELVIEEIPVAPVKIDELVIEDDSVVPVEIDELVIEEIPVAPVKIDELGFKEGPVVPVKIDELVIEDDSVIPVEIADLEIGEDDELIAIDNLAHLGEDLVVVPEAVEVGFADVAILDKAMPVVDLEDVVVEPIADKVIGLADVAAEPLVAKQVVAIEEVVVEPLAIKEGIAIPDLDLDVEIGAAGALAAIRKDVAVQPDAIETDIEIEDMLEDVEFDIEVVADETDIEVADLVEIEDDIEIIEIEDDIEIAELEEELEDDLEIVEVEMDIEIVEMPEEIEDDIEIVEIEADIEIVELPEEIEDDIEIVEIEADIEIEEEEEEEENDIEIVEIEADIEIEEEEEEVEDDIEIVEVEADIEIEELEEELEDDLELEESEDDIEIDEAFESTVVNDFGELKNFMKPIGRRTRRRISPFGEDPWKSFDRPSSFRRRPKSLIPARESRRVVRPIGITFPERQTRDLLLEETSELDLDDVKVEIADETVELPKKEILVAEKPVVIDADIVGPRRGLIKQERAPLSIDRVDRIQRPQRPQRPVGIQREGLVHAQGLPQRIPQIQRPERLSRDYVRKPQGIPQRPQSSYIPRQAPVGIDRRGDFQQRPLGIPQRPQGPPPAALLRQRQAQQQFDVPAHLIKRASLIPNARLSHERFARPQASFARGPVQRPGYGGPARGPYGGPVRGPYGGAALW